MYKNYLYSDEKGEGGEVDVGFVVPSERVLLVSCHFYALTKAANSAGRQGEKHTVIVCCAPKKKKKKHPKGASGCCAPESVPSAPILPSPSESPALRKVEVSASVSARAPALKFCRNSLRTDTASWLVHGPQLPPANTHFIFNMDITGAQIDTVARVIS